MGFLDRFKTKKKKPFDRMWTAQFLNNGSPILSSDSDDKYVKSGYQSNPTVNAIVGMTQKNAAMAKWGVYKKNTDGTKEPYRDAALEALLYQPNNIGSWNQLIQEMIGFKMLTGNSFLWGIPSDINRGVKSLYVLPSQDVQIHISSNQRSIAGYTVDFYGMTENDVIPYENVLHLRTFNPQYDDGSDFLYGQSPLKAAYRSLVTNNEMVDTVRAQVNNQGVKGLLYAKSDGDWGDLSQEQIDAMNQKFRKQHKGTGNAGDVHIAPGEYGYLELGSSLNDLGLIEHYQLTVNDICNVFNFPTLLLGSGESSYANQKEAKKALWSNVIIPALTEIREGLNQWLAPMYGTKICLDFDTSNINELQEDLDKQATAVSKMQNLATVNEARKVVGLPPLEGPEGDQMYMFQQGVVGDKPKEDGKEDTDKG